MIIVSMAITAIATAVTMTAIALLAVGMLARETTRLARRHRSQQPDPATRDNIAT
jgi:hypothetical protein